MRVIYYEDQTEESRLAIQYTDKKRIKRQEKFEFIPVFKEGKTLNDCAEAIAKLATDLATIKATQAEAKGIGGALSEAREFGGFSFSFSFVNEKLGGVWHSCNAIQVYRNGRLFADLPFSTICSAKAIKASILENNSAEELREIFGGK